MREKSTHTSLHESEDEVLAKANAVLAEPGRADDTLRQTLEVMAKEYEKLLRHQRKFIRISDGQTAELISANEKLTRLAAELSAEKTKLQLETDARLREAEQRAQVERDKRILMDRVSVAAQVSDLLNSPLLVALHVSEALAKQFASLEADGGAAAHADRRVSKLAATWASHKPQLTRALNSIHDLS